MNPSVDQPAAEREPELPCDNPSPHRGHRYVRLSGVYYICPGTLQALSRALESQPDNVTPELPPYVDRERIELGAAGCGCPITGEVISVGGELRGDIDGTERTEHRAGCWAAEPVDDTDIRVALAADLERMSLMPEPALDWSAYEACPSCWAQTGDPCVILGGYNPSTPHPDRQLKPVEPERRTVSLEVLTDELRRSAAEVYDDAKVGVVLRWNGEAVGVPEVDVPWGSRRKHPVAVLEAMLRQAQYYTDDNPGAELLMPTPDVLAALDGRPDAGFWSAPVPVTARHIEEGWLVVGYSGPGMEERVEAKNPECGAADCPWPGDCTQLTIGDDKPQHFADWTTLTVRIPASVIR